VLNDNESSREPPRFSTEQAAQVRDLCDRISTRPGMWIVSFNWTTAQAFWDGYMRAMDGRPFRDFRPWGLAQIGVPTSPLDPIAALKRQIGLADDAEGPWIPRERAAEISSAICGLIRGYVDAHSPH
jgi:hypothetical protein